MLALEALMLKKTTKLIDPFETIPQEPTLETDTLEKVP